MRPGRRRGEDREERKGKKSDFNLFIFTVQSLFSRIVLGTYWLVSARDLVPRVKRTSGIQQAQPLGSYYPSTST